MIRGLIRIYLGWMLLSFSIQCGKQHSLFGLGSLIVLAFMIYVLWFPAYPYKQFNNSDS